MTWKEFLMPDWRKVLLFLFIVAGIFYSQLESPAYLLNTIPMTITLQNGTQITSPGESLIDYLFLNPFLYVFIIFSYFFSCFIIYGHDKSKINPFGNASVRQRILLYSLVIFVVGIGISMDTLTYLWNLDISVYFLGIFLIAIGIAALIIAKKTKQFQKNQ